MFSVLGFLAFLACLPGAFWCLPLDGKTDHSDYTNFIGKATNDIGTALLQGYAGKEDNMAYSPLGFSTLLAVFSEGARGPSRDEIAKVLHFPEDVNIVRMSYKNLLKGLAEKNSNSPEFKNWFYIFKNYTVDQEFQDILREYYLTEVKHVDRPLDYVQNAEKVPIEQTIKENKKKAEADKVEEDDGHLEAHETFDMVHVENKESEKVSEKTEEKNRQLVYRKVLKSIETVEMTQKKAEEESQKPIEIVSKSELEPVKSEAVTKDEKDNSKMKEVFIKKGDAIVAKEEEKKEVAETVKGQDKPENTFAGVESVAPMKEVTSAKKDDLTRNQESQEKLKKPEIGAANIKKEVEANESQTTGETAEGTTTKKENVDTNAEDAHKKADQVPEIMNKHPEGAAEGSGDSEISSTNIKSPVDDVMTVPESSDSKVTDKKATEVPTKTESFLEPSNAMTEEAEEKDKPIKVNSVMGALPIEHFSGMTDSSIKIKDKESQPQMIVFNGMYYKGEWATPFAKKLADISTAFYKSEEEKVYVATIYSEGVYKTGSISNLDCQAIELPYKGDKYSLLILVPNSRNGLTKLISELSGYPLSSIHDQLSEKLVQVSLPAFEINTISKPVSSLKKLRGTSIKTIFDPHTADLSGISTKDTGLFVDELVQMVTYKVDAEYTKANFLSASIGFSRSNVVSFQVNQPFLFYLRDKSADLTIVNGKVVDPTPRPAFYFS